MNRLALTLVALLVISPLGGCTTIGNLFGPPSTNSSLNAFAAEESGATVAYNTAALWAQSGKETPAQAAFVEQARVGITADVAAARKARDSGDNVAMAQFINLAQQAIGYLTTYMTTNGAPAPQGAAQ